MNWTTDIVPIPVSATASGIRALDQDSTVAVGAIGANAVQVPWSVSTGLGPVLALPMPKPPAGIKYTGGDVHDIDGEPASLWAVGDTMRWGTSYFYQRMMLWHWDGVSWAEVFVDERPGGALVGVSVSPSADVFLVGRVRDAAGLVPAAFRMEDPLHPLSWTRGEVAIRPADAAAFEDVSALAGDDAVAVGYRKDGPDFRALLCRTDDGHNWKEVELPPRQASTALLGVQMIDRADAWAVGSSDDDNGVNQAYAIHWDGNTWTESPVPLFEKSSLWDVTALGPDNVLAVGAFWTGDRTHLMALHWDGSVWSQEQVPEFALPSGYLPIWPAGNQQLTAVSTADGGYWATGVMVYSVSEFGILSVRSR